jgi:hypothetical protein
MSLWAVSGTWEQIEISSPIAVYFKEAMGTAQTVYTSLSISTVEIRVSRLVIQERMAFGSILRSMESALTDGLVCWMVEQGDTSSGWMDGRVVREMGPSEAPLSRRLMLSGYELGADASFFGTCAECRRVIH